MTTIFLLFFVGFASFAEISGLCDVPPALWCDNEEISKKCGVVDACSAFNKSTYGNPIRITLLYETLCPDCQEFIMNVLYPKVFKYGPDFVQIELIPYGNARRSRSANGTVQISCQHGPVECSLNKLHSCTINQLKTSKRWFPFIYCMEMAIHSRLDPEKSASKCFNKTKITIDEQKAIQQCRNGSLGDELQMEMAKKTEDIWPEKHDFVPWIVVNDVSTTNMQINQDNLLNVLCTWFRGATKPKGCEFLDMVHQFKTCAA